MTGDLVKRVRGQGNLEFGVGGWERDSRSDKAQDLGSNGAGRPKYLLRHASPRQHADLPYTQDRRLSPCILFLTIC